MVKLSILIPTVSVRESLLSRLLATLEPQLTPEIEVIIHSNDDMALGDKCNRMFEEAKGRLIVSIDDDDNVTDDYVASVLGADDGQTDFIGYKIEYSRNGKVQEEIIHDARPGTVYGEWTRHLSLKCPISTAVARQFIFSNDFGGDMAWCTEVYNSGLIKYPTFIDKVLYLYDFWDAGTLGPKPSEVNRDTQRNVGSHPYDKRKFRWLT